MADWNGYQSSSPTTQKQKLPATVKPAGLSVTRAGLKFTLTWKCADEDYDGGIEVNVRAFVGQYNKKGVKGAAAWTDWAKISVLRGETSASKSYSASSYYPTTKNYLWGVEFRVRGKRKPSEKNDRTTTYDWSAWVSKKMELSAPPAPTVTQELDSTLENKTTFSWSVNYSDTNTQPFRNVEWQSIFVKDCTETDGSKLSWKSSTLGWSTGTGSAEGSWAKVDDQQLIGETSYTRWFRIRSRGCGGNGTTSGVSAWKYTKHVYAVPNSVVIDEVEKPYSSMWIRVKWHVGAPADHPVDSVSVQYVIGYPDNNLGVPTNPSWTTIHTYADTAGTDEITFLVDRTLELDECIWVRVTATHDRRTRYSKNWLVVCGKMTAPESFSVQTNPDSRTATYDATYNGDVPDAKIAYIFRMQSADGDNVNNYIIGFDSVGESVTYPVIPDGWSARFGVFAFQGSYEKSKDSGTDGVTYYEISDNMRSSNVWQGGYLPPVPTKVKVVPTETPGEVLMTWTWGSWAKSNRCELSWSKNPNAWESNKGPETYMLTSLTRGRWRISDLEIGVTWYFRIRLANETDRAITYGQYCDTVAVELASAPSIPVLSFTPQITLPGKNVMATWLYASTDGTAQKAANIYEVTYSGTTPVYSSKAIAAAKADRTKKFKIPSTYAPGEHSFAVKVQSASGQWSEYSDPAVVMVAEPLTCTIASTSLVERTIEDELGNEITVYDLTALPFTATITGAGAGGETQLIIERAEEYHMRRPDESDIDGYDGETIAIIRQSGESQISVSQNDLIGALDDGASYRLLATTVDGYGQTATKTLAFEVHWAHQAEIPSATVEIEDGAAVIVVAAPPGAVEGDVCDIYRLTADVPEMILQGGEFGVAYVDPYPAIGAGYGHRCVHRTLNGDYITEDNTPAWVDLTDMDGDFVNFDYGIIDFDGRQLLFRYNTELSSQWSKDFQRTRYLGGSIVGDWNPGVIRTTTINAIIMIDEDEDFKNLRRLADYTGICHVRTPEGSSYPADVQVGDSLTFDEAGLLVHATLTCTRVDAAELDGLTYEEWRS